MAPSCSKAPRSQRQGQRSDAIRTSHELSDIMINDRSANVAVVILNWRAADMTLRALRGVFEQSLQPRHVFVVENGSGDDSAAILQHGLTEYGEHASLLINDSNLGFGGGCNTALRKVLAGNYAYCWLLNNDAEPEPACLANLIATADSTVSVGAVGSLIVDPNKPEADHYGSWLDPIKLVSHALHAPTQLAHHRFAWMTAASLLVSVTALRQIGLFDERYFMYWEDADLNMRLRGAGFAVVSTPKARVKHVAGTSSHNMATQRYLWHFASQRLWLRQHHPLGRMMLPALRMKYLLKAVLDRDLERLKALLRTA